MGWSGRNGMRSNLIYCGWSGLDGKILNKEVNGKKENGG